MDVFMLYHIYEQKDDFGVHVEEKLIGIFFLRGQCTGSDRTFKR